MTLFENSMIKFVFFWWSYFTINFRWMKTLMTQYLEKLCREFWPKFGAGENRKWVQKTLCTPCVGPHYTRQVKEYMLEKVEFGPLSHFKYCIFSDLQAKKIENIRLVKNINSMLTKFFILLIIWTQLKSFQISVQIELLHYSIFLD